MLKVKNNTYNEKSMHFSSCSAHHYFYVYHIYVKRVFIRES